MPKRTASYVRGLTETRAYAAGEIQRYQQILVDVQEQLSAAQMDMAACDRLIKKYDSRLDPTKIEPVRATKRYGRYGNLRQAIVESLRDVYPGELTTTLIALEIQIRFGIDFITPAQRKGWVNCSVASALRALVAAGIVERLHDPRVITGEAGRWRLRSGSGPSADRLLEQLEASGEVVPDPDAVPE